MNNETKQTFLAGDIVSVYHKSGYAVYENAVVLHFYNVLGVADVMSILTETGPVELNGQTALGEWMNQKTLALLNVKKIS